MAVLAPNGNERQQSLAPSPSWEEEDEEDAGDTLSSSHLPNIFPLPLVILPQLPDETWLEILTMLDVLTLIKTKSVCRQFQQLCTTVINEKGITSGTRKGFETNQELRDIVKMYCNLLPSNKDKSNNTNTHTNNVTEGDETTSTVAVAAETIACSYGWPMGKWNVSQIHDFSFIFHWQISFNDGTINEWDVSNATTMRGMFQYTQTFNQSLQLWNVSNVTNFQNMFWGAKSFNQPLSTWNISSTTTSTVNMSHMFHDAINFNNDLSTWDTSNVVTMESMFHGATNMNHSSISLWDTTNVTTMENMFRDAINFNQDLQLWDTSNVLTMSGMFCNARKFNPPNLSTWNTSQVWTMRDMFRNATSFTGGARDDESTTTTTTISNWDTTNVSTMDSMFYGATSFPRSTITNWNIQNVRFIENIFGDVLSFDWTMFRRNNER